MEWLGVCDKTTIQLNRDAFWGICKIRQSHNLSLCPIFDTNFFNPIFSHLWTSHSIVFALLCKSHQSPILPRRGGGQSNLLNHGIFKGLLRIRAKRDTWRRREISERRRNACAFHLLMCVFLIKIKEHILRHPLDPFVSVSEPYKHLHRRWRDPSVLC